MVKVPPGTPADEGDLGGELLPAPSTLAQAAIAKHLLDVHGISPFELGEHVFLGGVRRDSQLISWNPALSTYHCELCPGFVFASGEITAERIQLAEMFDATLAPRLSGLDSEEQEEMARFHIKGQVNREELDRLREAEFRERSQGARPVVDARRTALQAWMLDCYARVGTVPLVREATYQLQFENRELWAELVGRPLSQSAIRDYWRRIPAVRRREAKAAFMAEREKKV
jgi:hypothetical protein